MTRTLCRTSLLGEAASDWQGCQSCRLTTNDCWQQLTVVCRRLAYFQKTLGQDGVRGAVRFFLGHEHVETTLGLKWRRSVPLPLSQNKHPVSVESEKQTKKHFFGTFSVNFFGTFSVRLLCLELSASDFTPGVSTNKGRTTNKGFWGFEQTFL